MIGERSISWRGQGFRELLHTSADVGFVESDSGFRAQGLGFRGCFRSASFEFRCSQIMYRTAQELNDCKKHIE